MKTFLVNSLTVGSLMLGAFFFGVWYADNKNGVNVPDSPRPTEILVDPLGAIIAADTSSLSTRQMQWLPAKDDMIQVNLFPPTHAQCDSIFKCQKQYRSSK